jgi:pimeloyl-ACP methyl ester carboxylesterase
MQERIVDANGLSFPCLIAGRDDAPKGLMLCLHGFPDSPHTFEGQFEPFAAAGYLVVAPYMRGYHARNIPRDGAYQSALLARDALALIESLGHRHAVVLGHDWGSVAAYAAAVLGPDRVSRVICASVPPGGAVISALLADPEQQRRSWYMFFFQLPFAEAAVAFNDFAFIERLWQDWSPGWAYSHAELTTLKRVLAAPGVLGATLSYYRAAFDPTRQRAEYAADQARLGEPIRVPGLYLHGRQDGCIGSNLADGVESQFPIAGSAKAIIEGAGHFLHREAPHVFNRQVLDFLA